MKALLSAMFCFFMLLQLTHAQESCGTGKVDPRIAPLLQSIPQLTMEQERAIPIADRRLAVPPDMNPIPEENMQRIKITADSIPVIVFRPAQTTAVSLPVVIEYHPGGFVWPLQPWMYMIGQGSAYNLNAIVFMVDYRVAPEFRFPAASNDSYHAYEWIAKNAQQFGGDTSRIILSGGSAGGNLAAAVCLQAVAEKKAANIKLQLLFCPNLDNPLLGKHPSYQQNAKGYGLTLNSLLWALENYTGDTTNRYARDTRLFPLQAKSFKGLPPTVILTTEFDPLRDEGQAYAQQLRAAGVPVYYKCFPGQTHTFMGLPMDAAEWGMMGGIYRENVAKYVNK